MLFNPDQYNTITNPIPNYNRNPYLNKVVTKAQIMAGSSPSDIRTSSVLSQAANQVLYWVKQLIIKFRINCSKYVW